VYYVFDTTWPGNGAKLAIDNYNSTNLNKALISKITLLGSGGASLAWTQSATALTVTMPAAKPAGSKYAYVLKIYLDAQAKAPAAPTYLQAAVSYPTANAVLLTWIDNATNATGYYVERSSNDTTFTRIATLPGVAVTSYNDSMAAPVAYYYRVQAYNAVGTSAYSDTATPGGLPSPTAVRMPDISAENRDFPNSLCGITTLSGDNTIRFMSAHDAPATFILYSLNGRVAGRITVNANRGPNILTWDQLKRGASSVYFLEMRVAGQSSGVVRMIRTR
jgi:hypothetical protein